MTSTLHHAVREVAAGPRRPRLLAWGGQALVWALVIGLIASSLLPLLYSSFLSKPYYLPGGVLTLGGYRTLFDDPAYWTAVRNTAVFATTTTAIAVPGGTAAAILCGRTEPAPAAGLSACCSWRPLSSRR